jgi:hypothetical protein
MFFCQEKICTDIKYLDVHDKFIQKFNFLEYIYT